MRAHSALQPFILLLLAALPWALLLAGASRGFDLTDEAFYLLSYRSPESIEATFSMFGFLGAPVYRFVDGDISLLRGLGIASLLLTSACAAWITLRQFAAPTPISDWLNVLLPTEAGALFYESWLLTPGYNWMTLAGLQVFWAGALLWMRTKDRRLSATGSMLIGAAAAFIWWTKPTSAALLPLLPLGILIVRRNAWRSLLAPPALLAGVLGLALGLSLPFLAGLDRDGWLAIIERGIVYQQILKPDDHSSIVLIFTDGLWRWFEFILINPLQILWLLPIGAAVALSRRWRRRPPTAREMRFARTFFRAWWALSFTLLGAMILLSVGYWALNVLLLTFSFWTTRWLMNARDEPLARLRPKLRRAALGLLPFGLAFVFVFGTINRYQSQSGMAAYFFVLGAAVVTLAFRDVRGYERAARAIAVFLLLLIAARVGWGSLLPYRQDAPVWTMEEAIALPAASAHSLLLSENMARYIRDLRALAAAAGYQPGTPIIDLTGRTPGAVYALDGRALVFPWLLSTYEGSNPAAAYALSLWPTEALREAWVLAVHENADQSDALSPSILRDLGLPFPEGYTPAGSVLRPISETLHTLWQPPRAPTNDAQPRVGSRSA